MEAKEEEKYSWNSTQPFSSKIRVSTKCNPSSNLNSANENDYLMKFMIKSHREKQNEQIATDTSW